MMRGRTIGLMLLVPFLLIQPSRGHLTLPSEIFREHLAGSVFGLGRAHLVLRFVSPREDVGTSVTSGFFRLLCDPGPAPCPGSKGPITEAGEDGPVIGLSHGFVFHVMLDTGNVCDFNGRFPFITSDVRTPGMRAGMRYYPDLSGTFVCKDSSGATIYDGLLLVCPGC